MCEMKEPVIRFKGYTDEWEQRKLGEITTKIGSGKTPRGGSEAYVDDGISLIRSQNVHDDVVDLSDVVYIDEETNKSMENSLVAYNDVLLNITGASIGRSAVYKGSEPANVNQHVCIIRPTEDYSSDFIQMNLASSNGQKQIDSSQAGGAREGLNFQQIGKMEFAFPSVQEQNKIGTYFSNLNNLIALHQRKCDDLQEVKKYMLQKLFPQNGAKIPEIRFAGFTGEWEQRKLGEVFEQTSNFVTPNEDIELWSLTVEDGLTPKAERYNREFLVKKEDNFKEVRPGDIVYNPMNMTLGAVGYTGMDKSVAVSGYYTTMIAKSDNDAYYINTWLKSPQALMLYRTYATGSLIEKQRVQFPTLSEIPVAFPEYEEQKRIGSFFSNLDDLITLHQCECDALKEVKKFMLQNMFPEG